MGQSPSAAPPQMQDASGKVNPATVHGTLSPNPTAGIAGGALAFSGSDQFLFTAIPQVHPDAFTLSLWFRANGTNSAGKLIGLESDTTALSPYFDRHIWLDSMGHLGFGVYPPAPSVIDPADSSFLAVGGGSPSAPRQVFIQRILKSPAAYADGAWHQVAATLSPLGQCMYVDGTLVAANDTVTTGAGFTGYWRIGGGTLRNWVGAPGKEYFSGTLDEVTVALHARNKTWIHSAYLTQKPSATLITLAPEY
jgi:hypothetical protein